MISERIKLLRKKFITNKIDGYIIPKNDEFFGEYSSQDRLKNISNFDGSAGLAIILKDKNLYIHYQRLLYIHLYTVVHRDKQ